MEITVFDINTLAERWGLAPTTIRKMEAAGRLHRLPDMPGVRFSAAEVYQLESIGREAMALTPWERRQKDLKIAEQDREIQELRNRINIMVRVAQGGKV